MFFMAVPMNSHGYVLLLYLETRQEIKIVKESKKMKIKVESEKIIKAVKKLDGIEIVLENPEDAKEAINLILRKTDLFNRDEYEKVKDVKVTSFHKYETSSVNYKMIFLLEFNFDEKVSLDMKASFIKGLQEFFDKV